MEVKITTLSENTALKPGFVAEWGLSILVEADGKKILFDTGAGTGATRNAEKLGIDLSDVDVIVLSHGHADHTGGLRDVLRRTQGQKIIAHPDIWAPKYTQRPGEKKAAYIGMPYVRDELESWGGSFDLVRDSIMLSENILTTGVVDMTTGYEQIEDNLLVMEKATLVKDPLEDDLALIVKTGKGLVVILGCAHRGIINTLYHAMKLTGVQKVCAVVGGTHLGPASDERVEKSIQALEEIGIEKIGVSHCTGFKASARIARAFGDRFFLNNAGTQVVF